MNKICRLALAALFVIGLRDAAKAQWLGGAGGFQYLTNPTNGVRVGTTNTTPPSALTVMGMQMNPATGEVFRTDANGNTNWRMFRAGQERGRLFSLNANGNFYMDSPGGGLRFRTQDTTRFVVLHLLTDSINGYPVNLTGFLGQGREFEGAATGTRPFTWHHVTEGSAPAQKYRPWLRVGSTYTQGTGMGYFGLRNVAGIKHAVLAWGDEVEENTGELRFTFVRNSNGTGIAAGVDGLEAARMKPASTHPLARL